MKWIVAIVALCISLAPATVSLSADSNDILFSVLSQRADGKWKWEETRIVPLIPSRVSYGYVLRVATSQTVRITEILTLPAKPQIWPQGPSVVISKDGRTMTSTREIQPNNEGLIANSWTVAEGDPSGDYELTILREGKLVATFHFEAIYQAILL
jgi:hypothetical protein